MAPRFDYDPSSAGRALADLMPPWGERQARPQWARYDYDGEYAAQFEEMRRQQEAAIRQQMEADQARQAEELRRAQEAQGQARPGVMPPAAANGEIPTLGDLMQPPGAPTYHTYDMGPAPPPAAPPAAPNVYDAAQYGGNPHVPGATNYYGGTAFPTGTPAPDRQTSAIDLDTFNTQIRHSEAYQQFVRERGIGREGAWGAGKWSERDREDWTEILRANGVQVPKGMKVDDAGNFNQKNTLGKKLLIGGALAAGTLATMGALGAFGGAAAGAGGSAAGGAAGTSTATGLGSGAYSGLFKGTGAFLKSAASVGSAATPPAAKTAGAAGMKNFFKIPEVITGLAGITTSALASRAEGKQADKALAAQERASASAEAIAREQARADADWRQKQFDEETRRFDLEQKMAAEMWAAKEDERLYQRRIFEEDRAARLGGGGGFSYEGPSAPDPAELRREQARRNLAALMAQQTPGYSPYTAATQAGPTGRV